MSDILWFVVFAMFAAVQPNALTTFILERQKGRFRKNTVSRLGCAIIITIWAAGILSTETVKWTCG